MDDQHGHAVIHGPPERFAPFADLGHVGLAVVPAVHGEVREPFGG